MTWDEQDPLTRGNTMTGPMGGIYGQQISQQNAIEDSRARLEVARAQSQNIVYSTLHGEVVALRAEVERQQAEIRELNEEIRRLDDVDQFAADACSFIEELTDSMEQANDCIERLQADLETLRAAHDGTSVDWRTR